MTTTSLRAYIARLPEDEQSEIEARAAELLAARNAHALREDLDWYIQRVIYLQEENDTLRAEIEKLKGNPCA